MKKCVLRFSRYAFFVLIPLFVLFTFCSCSGLFSDNEANYPAFWWAEHYSGSNNLGDYGNGWYLPAKNEMLAVYTNRTTISTAFGKIGTTYATDFGSSGDWEYWSSTQYHLKMMVMVKIGLGLLILLIQKILLKTMIRTL